MKSKVSKAQLEVWEWKESIYQTVKGMPIRKALEKIIRDSQKASLKAKSGNKK